MGRWRPPKERLLEEMEWYRKGDMPIPTQKQVNLAEEVILENHHSRYTVISIHSILLYHQQTDGHLEMMIQAFDVLMHYTINILKPNHPRNWHTIYFNDAHFKTQCDWMVGARDILKKMGYTVPKYGDDGVTETGLSFPDSSQIDYVKLKMIAAELLIAKVEVIMKQEGISIEHYLECKKAGFGTERLQLYKVLIFGPPGVGKSSLFQVLLGNNPSSTRNSTGVLDVVQVQVKIAISKPGLVHGAMNSSSWQIFSRKEEIARLHKIIQMKVRHAKALRKLDAYDSYQNSESDSAGDENDTQNQTSVQKASASNEELDSSRNSNLTTVEKSVLASTSTREKYTETILMCYDSGGHLEFFDVMPALTTLPTANIMVFDMKKGLGRCEVDGFYIESECHSSQGQTQFNCTKLLQSAVANIQSLAKKRDAFGDIFIRKNLLVVGTHLDNCGTSTEQAETVKRLDEVIYEQVLAKNTSLVKTREFGKDSKIIHPISNTDASPERDMIAQEIRTAIEEMTREYICNNIQVEWYLFQLEIQETQKSYIGRSEYIEIAKNCNMSEHDAERALEFYHNLGILLHYRGLVDVVFCNPQWLFDRLTDLIIQKYKPYTFDIKENVTKGKFSTRDLLEIYKAKLDQVGTLTLTNLLDIFVHHNIMAHLPNKDEYFMPALLQTSPENLTLSDLCGRKSGDTLLVEFEKTYVPRGVFCCLVVNLARNGWVVLENATYKDLIVFQISPTEFFVLVDKIKYIGVEVYLKENQKITISHLSIFLQLHQCLKNTCAQMRIDWNFSFGFAGICSACTEIACVDCWFMELKCKTCGKTDYMKNYEQLLWFLPPHVTEMIKQQPQPTSKISSGNDYSSVSESGSKPVCCKPTPSSDKIEHQDDFCLKPTERTLARLRGILTPHWRDIGYELIKPEDVRVIDCNSQVDKEEKCFAMLLKWLEADATACYCKIIKALNIYELPGIVDKVKARIQA